MSSRTPTISRRGFIGLAAVATASAGLAIPPLKVPREPYVKVNQGVSYIGLARHPEPTFIGSTSVAEVGEWDGTGYPCLLRDQCFYSGPPRYMQHRFYDSDLADLTVEVPPRFWANDFNRHRYPCVHAYVRERRYGEDPAVWRAVQERLLNRRSI